MEEKSWQEFRDTGLFMFINTILHAFGWSIVLDINEKNELISVYPARVGFRGFESERYTDMYQKMSKFIDDNSSDLLKESKE